MLLSILAVSVLVTQAPRKPGPPPECRYPKQQVSMLLSAITKSDRMEIHSLARGERLFVTQNQLEIASFRNALMASKPVPVPYCACLGNEQIFFFSGSTTLAAITVHHGSSIRIPETESDIHFRDPRFWSWFICRKIELFKD